MSTTLMVNWPKRRFEETRIGDCDRIDQVWKPLALELGLALAAQLADACFPVRPDNIDPLLKELALFREALVGKGAESAEDLRGVDLLVAELDKLKQSEGWRASIGIITYRG